MQEAVVTVVGESTEYLSVGDGKASRVESIQCTVYGVRGARRARELRNGARTLATRRASCNCTLMNDEANRYCLEQSGQPLREKPIILYSPHHGHVCIYASNRPIYSTIAAYQGLPTTISITDKQQR